MPRNRLLDIRAQQQNDPTDEGDSTSRYYRPASPPHQPSPRPLVGLPSGPRSQRRGFPASLPSSIPAAASLDSSPNPPARALRASRVPLVTSPAPDYVPSRQIPSSRPHDFERDDPLPVHSSRRDTYAPPNEGTQKRKGGKMIGKGGVPFEPMEEYFHELGALQDLLREAISSIQEVAWMHTRLMSFPSSDNPRALALTEDLANLTTSLRASFASIAARIHSLDQGNANLGALIPAGLGSYGISLADVEVRNRQLAAFRERFKTVGLARLAEVERDNRQTSRTRIERQIKIVNPSLTPSELQEVVRQAETGSGALFSQALLAQNQRSHSARGALREVQSRAAELSRIEETLVELAQLFGDMAMLVESQDIEVQRIEQHVVDACSDVEVALVHTQKAVVSTRSTRKMRWCCFSIFATVLLIILIVVIVEVILPLVRKNSQKAT